VLRQTDPMTMVVLPVLGWGPALSVFTCVQGWLSWGGAGRSLQPSMV
jgi:hypothetical protein